MLRPQKGNFGALSNYTLLNLGLRAQSVRQGIVMKTVLKHGFQEWG